MEFMTKQEAIKVMHENRPTDMQDRSIICDKITKATAWGAMMSSIEAITDGYIDRGKLRYGKIPARLHYAILAEFCGDSDALDMVRKMNPVRAYSQGNAIKPRVHDSDRYSLSLSQSHGGNA